MRSIAARPKEQAENTMARLVSDILDKDANILHRENYVQSGKGEKMRGYLRRRASFLVGNPKSIGVFRVQPTSFRISEGQPKQKGEE